MLEGIVALAEPEHELRIRAFLAEHPVPQGHRLVEQHLERLAAHTALRARERDRLAAAIA
jgi:hypothetical protein